MALHYFVAMGLNKGHKVTKNMNKPRQKRCCRHLIKHIKFMRDRI